VPPERALRTRGSEGLPACQLCLLSLPPQQLAIDFLIAPATDAGIGVGQSYCFKQLVAVHQVTLPFISPGHAFGNKKTSRFPICIIVIACTRWRTGCRRKHALWGCLTNGAS